MSHHVANKPQPRLGLAFVVLVVVLNFLTFADAASRPVLALGLCLLALCPVLPLPSLRGASVRGAAVAFARVARAQVTRRTGSQDPDAAAAGVRLRLSTPG